MDASCALNRLMNAALNVTCRRREHQSARSDNTHQHNYYDMPIVWVNLQRARATFMELRRQVNVVLNPMSPLDMQALWQQHYWDLLFSLVHVPHWDPVLGNIRGLWPLTRLVAGLGDGP
jgi:hypothetical protein